MTDDLNAPLGCDPPAVKPRAQRRPATTLAIALALCGLVGAALIGLLWRNATAPAGVSAVITPIEPAPPPPQPLPPPAAAAPTTPLAQQPPVPPTDNAFDANALEQQSGVRVRRGSDITASGARIIHIEPDAGVRLPSAPDARVAETGPHGVLPRISREGLRPMDVYARPFVTSTTLRPDAPKIALIVGGVGLNAQGAASALALPEAVTLAFPPYEPDVATMAARARARGHETLLQAPMEPFDYPRNDPGPHTLVIDKAESGTNDLHWLMSRFSGYAGVINYLGGRYMADDAALGATLAEIERRGLYFVDDGEARQSRVAAIAPALSLPHAIVDVSIDARATPQSIDSALTQLELRAREKGAAIGFVNAAPMALAQVARFVGGLEKRGLALAPVSAILVPGALPSATPEKKP
jgi:polysaccharide deacetylase 2 family uncharacterized protein YibQ